MEKQETVEASKVSRITIMEKAQSESHREYLDMDTDEEEFGHQDAPEPEDEAPAEPDKPVFTNEEIDKLLNYTKALTVLPDLTESSWNENCAKIVRQFFLEPTNTVLCIFFRKNELRALLDYPESTDGGLAYFARTPWQVYTVDNFKGSVTFGSVDARTEVTTLKFVGCMYAPKVFRNNTWPKIMRNEIFSNINDFLSRAIDATYRPMGILILYIPWEGDRAKRVAQRPERTGERSGPEADASDDDRELRINRLEKVSRTWIKEVRRSLGATPILTGESYDVGREFEFWQNRYENLACIAKQLANDRLLSIIEELKKIKSTSIDDLKLLNMKFRNALEEAKSNLIFLDIIVQNCRALNDPTNVQHCAARILHVMRFVWTESSYYNAPKHIERLLCSLSVHVIKLCRSSVDLKLIFDDPKKCRDSIETCMSCCNCYSKMYDIIIDDYMTNKKNWNVQKNIVFNCIIIFQQRCQDVFEICDTIIVYGSLKKINMGGTRGNQHELRYRQAMEYFLQIVNNMRVCYNNALEIADITWFRNMSHFRSNIAKLEKIIKNLIEELFEDVKNVEMGIETLYTLLKLKDRSSFQDLLHNKWAQIWNIFFEEIKLCSTKSMECEIVQDNVKLLQSEKSLMIQINKKYLTRLHQMMTNASDWLGDCDIQSEAPLNYLKQAVYS